MRHSYEERICDDLSADILNLLPFEDKLRLRCVSKQFQRTVLLRQTDLPNFLLKKQSDLFIKLDILEKMPNINEIVIESREIFETYNLLRLLDKLDSKLISLNFAVEYLHFFDYLLKDIPFDRLVNIEELLIMMCHGETPNLSAIHFKRIKRFEFHCVLSEEFEVNHLEVFIGNHANTIRYLSIIDHFGHFEDVVKRLVEMVKRVKVLLHLTLIFDYHGLDFKTYGTYLRHLAKKCTHLKSLQIQYPLNDSESNENRFPINHFKGLKRLGICFHGMIDSNIFSLKTFHDFKELNHLIIRFYGSETLNEKLFEEIDTYLPKLRSLSVLNRIEATKWLGDILSRIKSIESIDINLKNESIISYIERKLIHECKRFKSLSTHHKYPETCHSLKHYLCERLHTTFGEIF